MAEHDPAATTGVLSTYMDRRNQVIAGRYQQAVSPAAGHSLNLQV